MAGGRKTNYLNNKDILAEIHKSKNTYCYYIDDNYRDYDVIIPEGEEITSEHIEEGKKNRAKKIGCDIDSISPTDVVIRFITYDHVPKKDPSEISENAKNTVSAQHVRLNFVPFKHFIIQKINDYEKNDFEFTEVGRSHWENGLSNGNFNKDHGTITSKLGHMFMLLVDRYSQRSNIRGYTYLDEMKSWALVQLCSVGLRFDESRSQNPFAYYTATINNSFTRVLNLEKRNQTIRDEMLIGMGASPSHTKQIENEFASKE